MTTFKSICEDSLKERKENVGLERVLGRVFDELISEFKAKFIKKISVLVHEVKHSDCALEVGKGGVQHYKREKYENRQKEQVGGKTHTDDTLGVYLSNITYSKRKSLFEKIKKEIDAQGEDHVTERGVSRKRLAPSGFTTVEEQKIYDSNEKVNVMNVVNDGKKKIDEVSVLDRRGKSVSSARNYLSDMHSKANSRKSGRSTRSRDTTGDGGSKGIEQLRKLDRVEKRNLSEVSEQMSMSDMSEKSQRTRTSYKSRTSRVSHGSPASCISRTSRKTNHPREDLCTLNGESNKSEKDTYANIISKYTIKRLFSNRLHTDEVGDTHCGIDERRADILRSAHIDKARRYMHEPSSISTNGGKAPSSKTNEFMNEENKNYKIVKRDFDDCSKRSVKSKANSLGSEREPLDILIAEEAKERNKLKEIRGRSNGYSNRQNEVEVKSHKGDSTSIDKSEQLFFEVIRGKKRKHLKGFECEDCKSFYEELCWDGSEEGRKYKGGTSHRSWNRHEVSKPAQNELLLKKDRGKKSEGENYTNRLSEYVNEKYTNGTQPDTVKSFGEMALVSSPRYFKNGEGNVDMGSGKYAEKYIDKFMKKFEMKEKNKGSLVKMNQVEEEKFYEVDEVDDTEEELPTEVAEDRRKENKKKKLIQSFSRHRYHSKVNDSPKNFWSFDFFK
ncbi:conserved Plasmodium protein, unknown function [Plasmodium knowlesi strain H]|uniref:DNA endonuclease activator Ctp1 C-terminal domain-containing protein n=3 Tax=Plasmodium knowlesi TaxID=5850 RepID=A0A5K1VIP2_PLAKH|nr:SAE2 domain-containing protein, putative [Plasmodium knowlesi strain H]OTN68310.1 Uncharacterized protein PKNOH_S03330800 [Plasmodium knowlesi]CAA9987210.1 SAE2 domain-containing protein, putative [Plasmodium knowlesi strain H]SBO23975.1 conserved Plasmodium protein, unknown function [Plasmodium knowlesi strain H]SBO25941.1 conserved Plasmodium protein, unknown function [Plasmodium knowlesi strain H]VVS76684.1 SAE2 domain-containing protein, putative [Plasmodium knowlesi strain H]|eukprot:XP_002261831.1 hypothetical protein, conserved in Plasmodium species [Plasmodium knowlesi strain H]